MVVLDKMTYEQDFDNYSFDLDFDDAGQFSLSSEDENEEIIKVTSKDVHSPTNVSTIQELVNSSNSKTSYYWSVLPTHFYVLFWKCHRNNGDIVNTTAYCQCCGVIEETEYLLRKTSSNLTIDSELDQPVVSTPPRNSLDQPVISALPRNSILGTKHISDALPVIDKMKPKKSVRFDMALNIISEIQQPELDRHDSVDSNDSFEQVLSNKKAPLSRDSAAEKSTVQPSSQIINDIEKLTQEKETLLKDISELKRQHEKEMKQLRTEYEDRRESYYEELDQVRLEVDSKREQLFKESNTSDDDHNEQTPERRNQYNKRKESIEELEKSLEVRREQALQQEVELKEFESYLERRHKTLTQKEGDLCTLQDELEQLAVALQDREKELKELDESISNERNKKICEHNDDEIQEMRDACANLEESERRLQYDLNQANEKLVKKREEIKVYEEEVKRLNSKNKLLESQLSVTIKHSPSHREKGTTLSLISRNSNEHLGSPLKKQKDSNNNIKSPQRNSLKYSSPVSTASSVGSSSNEGGYITDDLLEGERISNDYLDGTANSPLVSPKSMKSRKNDDSSKSVISKTCTIM